jgi:hypothetical protein
MTSRCQGRDGTIPEQRQRVGHRDLDGHRAGCLLSRAISDCRSLTGQMHTTERDPACFPYLVDLLRYNTHRHALKRGPARQIWHTTASHRSCFGHVQS